MKRFFINFVAVTLVAVSVIGLSSCKDEVHYSCNPTIDGIIKQNLPYYQGMTRDKWKNLPDSLKRAAFVAMSPELKKEFWKGKQKEMMNAKFFSGAEKTHISKLYNYLLSIDDLYTNKYVKDSVEMQKLFDYYKEWAFYGIDSLNWNVIDVFLIAENGEELTEGYIEHVKQNAAPATHLEYATGGSDGDKPNCNCSWDGGCMGQGSCDDTNCTMTNWGCKFIWLGSCTKRCSDAAFAMNGNVIDIATYSNQRELFEYMLK